MGLFARRNARAIEQRLEHERGPYGEFLRRYDGLRERKRERFAEVLRQNEHDIKSFDHVIYRLRRMQTLIRQSEDLFATGARLGDARERAKDVRDHAKQLDRAAVHLHAMLPQADRWIADLITECTNEALHESNMLLAAIRDRAIELRAAKNRAA